MCGVWGHYHCLAALSPMLTVLGKNIIALSLMSIFILFWTNIYIREFSVLLKSLYVNRIVTVVLCQVGSKLVFTYFNSLFINYVMEWG